MVNEQLRLGTFKVVIQGKPEESQNRETPSALANFCSRDQDTVTMSIPKDIQLENGGVYIKAGTVLAILEFEVDESQVSKQSTCEFSRVNHIMEERFTPVPVNSSPTDGESYAIANPDYKMTDVDFNTETLKAIQDPKTLAAPEHVLQCAQPAAFVRELRRQVAEKSVCSDTTPQLMQEQAKQDLNDLFCHFSSESQKMSVWATQTLDRLVTDTVLQTTRIHTERLVDRCRTVEAHRLLAKDRQLIPARGQILAPPSDSAIRYRQLVADNSADGLRRELRATMLRTHYMEQLKATLRSVEYTSQMQDIDQDTTHRITKLIGTAGQHQQCDDVSETTAAQLQGLLAEALPPRRIREETVSKSKTPVHNKSNITAHDRFLCSIRFLCSEANTRTCLCRCSVRSRKDTLYCNRRSFHTRWTRRVPCSQHHELFPRRGSTSGRLDSRHQQCTSVIVLSGG